MVDIVENGVNEKMDFVHGRTASTILAFFESRGFDDSGKLTFGTSYERVVGGRRDVIDVHKTVWKV